MRIDREYFIRFAVAVALACYDLPTDRAMTSEEAAQLVKWVIDMALGPDASNVQVEPMENYPASSKMPLTRSSPLRKCAMHSPRCSARSLSAAIVSRHDGRLCI